VFCSAGTIAMHEIGCANYPRTGEQFENRRHPPAELIEQLDRLTGWRGGELFDGGVATHP